MYKYEYVQIFIPGRKTSLLGYVKVIPSHVEKTGVLKSVPQLVLFWIICGGLIWYIYENCLPRDGEWTETIIVYLIIGSFFLGFALWTGTHDYEQKAIKKYEEQYKKYRNSLEE